MVLFKDSLAQWAPVRKDGSQNANGTPSTFGEMASCLTGLGKL